MLGTGRLKQVVKWWESRNRSKGRLRQNEGFVKRLPGNLSSN